MAFEEAMTEAERTYRHFYRLLPQVWEEPAQDWNELVRRYHRAGIFDIPEEAPSPMGTVLTEEEFFGGQNQEVVCFNNLRYCPPFIHKLEFIKIIYVTRGCVTVYLNGVKHIIPAGGFCIVTPEVVHTVFSGHDEDVVTNILMRRSSFAHAFSGLLVEQNILSDFFWKILYTKHSNRILMFLCPNDEKLDRLTERMRRESERGEHASSLLMKSYVMIFLGIVMREHLKELQTLEELTDKVYVMPAILEEMKRNLKTVTLEELCRRFAMKETDLKHYIVQESGYSFSYLLRDLRLRRAVWLLENTKLSIEHIMEEVGYSNATSFYKSFKAKFGKTPLEYRNSGAVLV